MTYFGGIRRTAVEAAAPRPLMAARVLTTYQAGLCGRQLMNHLTPSQLRPVRDATGTVTTIMLLLAAVHLLWEPISPVLWASPSC